MSDNKLKLIKKRFITNLKRLEGAFYDRIVVIRKKQDSKQIEEIRKSLNDK